MNITTDPRDEDRKPPSNPWLERIELRCAQAWAGSQFDLDRWKGQIDFQFLYLEMLDWKRAWTQIRELRYGRTIEFHYRNGEAWRAVAPGVAVKP